MRKIPTIASLLLFCAACGGLHAQIPATQPITLGQSVVSLDRGWKFHTGDDLQWANPDFDDSGWASIKVGRAWEGQGYKNYTGYAWYRRDVVLDTSNVKRLDLGLLFPVVEDSCEVYWNGRFIGLVGQLPPHPVWYYSNWSSVILLGEAHSGVLAIRVWKSPYYFLSNPNEGGLVAAPQVGTMDALDHLKAADRFHWLQGMQFSISVAVVSAVIAVLALLAWFRNRKRRMLLWLAIVTSHSLLMLLLLIPGFFTFRIWYGSIGVVIAIYDVGLWFLLLYLLGLYENRGLVRFTRYLSVFVLISSLIDTFFEIFDLTWRLPRLFLFMDVASTLPVELCELYGVLLVVLAFRKRLDPARWLLVISALIAELYQASNDITGLGTRWTHWTFFTTLNLPLFTIAGNQFTFSTLVQTLLLIAILYAAWRYSVEQNRRQRALEQEYRSAQEVQRVLIPAVAPATPGFTVESVYLPASEVGGDFFQVLPADDGSLLIVVGDVSGKGLKAAMTVSAIVGALRNETERQPAAVLSSINRVLHGQITGFVACTAALISANGNMTIANAGNIAPYLNGEELAVKSDLPLGVLANNCYFETTYHLGPDDRITFVSDGVVEATNENHELFGFERTLAISNQSVTAIAEAARQFGQQDDISVLSVILLPALKEALA